MSQGNDVDVAKLVQWVGNILGIAVKAGASDIHFRADLPPMMRVSGELMSMKQPAMDGKALRLISDRMTPTALRKKAEELDQVDFSAEWQGTARFRVHRFRERGEPALVLRLIPLAIPDFQALRLPGGIKQMADFDRGLLLVTGATGMGKSTTIASLLTYMANRGSRHILTIEDPIEFIIPPGKSMVTQREVGRDVSDLTTGMWAALREDPDVIFLGETRDADAVRVVLQAAETGHLVISAIHTVDVLSTIEHLINLFPSVEQQSARLRLAAVLQGVISQRLLPAKGSRHRVLASELMLRSGGIQECIRKPERTKSITERMAGAVAEGMHTFDQDLRRLFEAGVLDVEIARSAASSPTDFMRNLHVM